MKIQLEQLDLLQPWPKLALREGYHEIRILVRLGAIPIGQIPTRPIRKRTVTHRRLRRRIASEYADAILRVLAQEGLAAGPKALQWFMPAGWGNFEMSSATADERRTYVEERFLLSTGLASPLREWVIESQQSSPAWPMPAVTVALCTRDREHLLEDAIRSLQRLNYPNYDILVVNNSTDPVPTAEIAARMGVATVRCRVAGVSRARNTALAHAGCDWVAFIDDDARPEANWLRELVRLTQDEKCRAVIGQTIAGRLENAAEIALDTYETRTGNLRGGGNLLIDRVFALKIGGFDEELGVGSRSIGGGETIDLLQRVRQRGLNVHEAPRALIHHHRELAARDLRRRIYGLAAGRASHCVRRRLIGQFSGQFASLRRDLIAATSGRSRYAFSLVLLEMKATLTGPLSYLRLKLSRSMYKGKPQRPVEVTPATARSTDRPTPIRPRLAA